MDDVSSDEDKIGTDFDGDCHDGKYQDDDSDGIDNGGDNIMLEMQVEKQHGQAMSGFQQPVGICQQQGSSFSPAHQVSQTQGAGPPAAFSALSATTLQQQATVSTPPQPGPSQQHAPNQDARSSTAIEDTSKLVPALSRLGERKDYEKELSLINATKIICSLDLLLEVFKKCQQSGCKNVTKVKYHLVGPTVVLNWKCAAGHKGRFCSSKDVNEIKANNLQTAAAIMLSGNNFAKAEKMAKFSGLSFISETTFYRLQRLYFIPAINKWWS